jgi:fructosamine-3-kinase
MHHIFEDCGLQVTGYEPVHGGDINSAFCLNTADGNYFLKVNDAQPYPGMFEKEADGLTALRNNSGLIVPAVIKTGTVTDQQYLLLEWLEKGSLQADTWQQFGRELAAMHRRPQAPFGWHLDNYIGNLPQLNMTCDTWTEFFFECRVLPLVKRLADRGIFNKRDVQYAERLRARGDLFPEEPASLLHGDLWNGNFMITNKGRVSIYDSAVYCGHREMDIGMAMLFGGFDVRFYDAYNEVYPLSAGWRGRLPLAQLYPLLVHAVLFSGHYISEAREIIQRYGQ